jgi:hypothetical protein
VTVDGSRVKAEQTLENLGLVQRNFEDISNLRAQRLLEAVQAGNSLRAVAEVAQCSYESVRRLIGPNAVVFGWNGATYVMTEHVTRMLEYKASGFARNAFPGDVEQLGAGTKWLADADQLARELQAVGRGEAQSIRLTKRTAWALYQILRLTYTGRPSRLADLADDLQVTFVGN